MKIMRTPRILDFPNHKVPSHRGHRGYGPGVTQSRESVVFKRDGVQRVETHRLTIVKENHHALFPKKVRDVDLHSLLRNLRPAPSSLSILGQDSGLRSWRPPSLPSVSIQPQGVSYHWFYSFRRNSFWNFHEVIGAFYSQFTSQRKFLRNKNYLFTFKIKARESLKNYVIYFQS